MASALQTHQFTIFLVLTHILFLVLIGLFGEYDANTTPSNAATRDELPLASTYPMFQDTHVMIFIGFGFLMTFLKRYGFSAVSINLLLACYTIEWSMIVRGMMESEFTETGKFKIGVVQLLTADFAAAVILISMGALLGKLSPMQYCVMAFFEVPAAIGAEHLANHFFKINDIGDSIVVHTFGAYFGLACSRAFNNKKYHGHPSEGSVYHSDIFAMIGAIFLWVFWPSFNAAVASPADAKERAVCNTYLSITACTIVTFIMSQALDKHKRFEMVHIANSTLAGGVAIGTIANVVLNPLHALLVGTLAGVLSVVGFKFITPLLASKAGIHDTCGVNNLHGMPGVLAGLLSALFIFIYPEERYGASINNIYSGVKSASNPDGFAYHDQAINQLIGLGIVFGIAIVTGFITGFILKLKFLNQVRESEYYADGDYFEIPGDYDFTSRIAAQIDHVELAEYAPLNQKEV